MTKATKTTRRSDGKNSVGFEMRYSLCERNENRKAEIDEAKFDDDVDDLWFGMCAITDL